MPLPIRAPEWHEIPENRQLLVDAMTKAGLIDNDRERIHVLDVPYRFTREWDLYRRGKPLNGHAEEDDSGKILNSEEAAEYLGMKTATLACWRCTGKGPKYVKVGRLVGYRRQDLDLYLSENVQG